MPKKICMLCLTVYEDENIENCPNCKLPSTLPKSMTTLCDYDEYEANLNKLQDSNSAERKQYNKLMSQFSHNNNPSPELVDMLNSDSVEKKRFAEVMTQIQTENNSDAQSSNLPKCPTCGSTNIRHISATERGVNAFMFGIFGTKRKHQFECQNPNCKYRW